MAFDREQTAEAWRTDNKQAAPRALNTFRLIQMKLQLLKDLSCVLNLYNN
jgi:hypothetical protein